MNWSTVKNILIFTGLGLLSYSLIINYTDFSAEIAAILYSRGALLYTVLAFILVGYSTLLTFQWVSRQYMMKALGRRKLFAAHFSVALIFLLINYSLLVVAKALADVEPVYTFSKSGWYLMILVWLTEMLIIELLLSNYTSSENQKLKQEAARLQVESAEARYAALQTQLNPHFLFNSLNTLKAEIRYNPGNAEKFTQHLSNVYRYVLQCQDKRLVPVSSELEFIRSYIFLHKVRLGECISFECDVPEELQEGLVPPLCLQLLVENVIKHNSISTTRPMQIQLFTEDGHLVVRNRKSPKKSTSENSGIGLKNLDSRCTMMIGEGLGITDGPDFFTVRIPIKYEND